MQQQTLEYLPWTNLQATRREFFLPSKCLNIGLLRKNKIDLRKISSEHFAKFIGMNVSNRLESDVIYWKITTTIGGRLSLVAPYCFEPILNWTTFWTYQPKNQFHSTLLAQNLFLGIKRWFCGSCVQTSGHILVYNANMVVKCNKV